LDSTLKKIDRKKKIYVAGHNGMVGSAIVRKLAASGFMNIITIEKQKLDLRNENLVDQFFQDIKPDYVILAAAKVGGIQANINDPVGFLQDNLLIEINVIRSAYKYGTEKFVFLGSSCIYPKEAKQPIKEEYLLTGKLEPTNEGYALSKIIGLKLCDYYKKKFGFNCISLMPCNLYGPNDSFDLINSHVLSALVRKFVDAAIKNYPEVIVWGSGEPKREFMHVSDLADAVVYFLDNDINSDFINIGWGEDISIKELAALIKNKTNYQGRISWDTSKPDGMMRKCLDITKMKNLGYAPKFTLEQGIDEMIQIYLKKS
jgi:GDP-L-fucose synthase